MMNTGNHETRLEESMNDPLVHLFMKCTVPIYASSNEQLLGTGFFVAPGVVLTCRHVVNDHVENDLEIWMNPERYDVDSMEIPREDSLASLLPILPIPEVRKNQRQVSDFALLHVSTKDHPCVLLERGIQETNDRLYVFGYTAQQQGGEPMRMHYEGPSTGQLLDKYIDSEIRPGASGSPVLNIETGKVIALISIGIHSKEPHPWGGRGVPITNVLEVFPELAEANKRFHAEDRRWMDATDRRMQETLKQRRAKGPTNRLPTEADGSPLHLWNLVKDSGSTPTNHELEHFVLRVVNAALDQLKQIETLKFQYPHFRFYDQAHLEDVLRILDQKLLGPNGVTQWFSAQAAAVCIVSVYLMPLAMAPDPEWFHELADSESALRKKYDAFCKLRPEFDPAICGLIVEQLDDEEAQGPLPSDREELLFAYLVQTFILEECKDDLKDNKFLTFWLDQFADGDEEFYVPYRTGSFEDMNFRYLVSLLVPCCYHPIGWFRKERGKDAGGINHWVVHNLNLALYGDLLRLATLLSFDAVTTPQYFIKEIASTRDKNFFKWSGRYARVRDYWHPFVDPEFDPKIADADFPKEESAVLDPGPDPKSRPSLDQKRWLRFNEPQCWNPVHQKRIIDLCDEANKAWTAFRAEIVLNGGNQLQSLPGGTVYERVIAKTTADGQSLYIYRPLSFELTQEKILDLLMGERIYGDPALCIRELIQNALDALERMDKLSGKSSGDQNARPELKIDVTWDDSEGTITIRDYGVGMDVKTIEDYFAQIGQSYYRSSEFERERNRLRERGLFVTPISQFGIGVLSCFMIADRIYVRSRPVGEAYPGKDLRPSNLWLQGVGNMFYFEGEGASHEGRPDLYLDERGTEITLFLKKTEFKIGHDQSWVDQLRFEFGHTDDDPRDKSKASKRKDKRRDDKHDSEQPIVEIDPAYLIGRYFVWPKYPIRFPETDLDSIDESFHIRSLCPISFDEKTTKGNGWRAPLPDTLGWVTYDWEDSKDPKNGTGSRIRLIYPHPTHQGFEGDRRSSNPFPPRRVGEMELTDIAAFVDAHYMIVSKQVLINGMYIPDMLACESLIELFGALGSMVWVDLRGIAAPPLSVNRLRVVDTGKEWRAAQGIIREVLKRFRADFDTERRQLEGEQGPKCDCFSGLAGPGSLWKVPQFEDSIQHLLPTEGDDQVFGWREKLDSDLSWAVLKLLMIRHSEYRDASRAMQRYLRGRMTSAGETDQRNPLLELEEKINETVGQFKKGKKKKNKSAAENAEAPDDVDSENEFAQLTIGRTPKAVADKVCRRAVDVLEETVTGISMFICKKDGQDDFLKLQKGIEESFKRSSNRFLQDSYVRHEVLAHVGSNLKWRPKFQETHGLLRTGPALFVDRASNDAGRDDEIQSMVAEYDIVFPFTGQFQGELGEAVHSAYKEDAEKTLALVDMLRIIVGLPFVLPKPDEFYWKGIDPTAQCFFGVTRIHAVIPNSALWLTPFREWPSFEGRRSMNTNGSKLRIDPPGTKSSPDYSLENYCLVGYWDIAKGRVGFQRGLVPKSDLRSGCLPKETHIEDIKAGAPPAVPQRRKGPPPNKRLTTQQKQKFKKQREKDLKRHKQEKKNS